MNDANQMVPCDTDKMLSTLRSRARRAVPVGLMALMAGCAVQPSELDPADETSDSTTPATSAAAPPTGKGGGLASEQLQRPEHAPVGYSGSDSGIYYHGGSVIPVADVYYIFYGIWNASQVATLTDFAQHIGDSPYFNINKTYPGVTGHVVYSGSTSYLGYPWGTDLNDGLVAGIVTDAINNGRVPYDVNGVYFVLGDANVNETSGFCASYCGWHTSSHLNWFGGPIDRFAFVGNPAHCPNTCISGYNRIVSPNGDVGVDGMISVIAHELEEAATDPDHSGWYDNTPDENADKCAWNFGAVYTTANGSKANMRLGTRDYLIQQNWVNAPGVGCALRYPMSGDFNNGGFESGNLGGWTPSGSASTTLLGHTGSYVAQVGSAAPTNGDSTITQSIFVPAQGGTLSFWYNVHCPDTLTYDWATATLYDFSTNVTSTVLPPTCTNTNQWQKVSFNLSANAGHWVNLTLVSHDDNYAGDSTYTLFDDVAMDN